MCVCKIVLIFFIVCSAMASTQKYSSKSKEETIINKLIMDCLKSNQRLSCFSEKAAKAIERSMDMDISLFDGITLVINEERANFRIGKSLNGVSRLSNALLNFINSHIISINLSQLARARNSDEITAERKGGDGGGGSGGGGGEGGGSGFGGGGGGLFSVDRKDLQKEKKYYRYAFMVLLGIFGLTGPLVMKILGIAAAHSLLAAKAALIIVGSVALKKLFEREEHKPPKIKVHTVHSSHDSEEQDYDRMGYSYNHIPYGYSSYNAVNHPYSAYASNDFAPILYGTPYDSKKTLTSR